MSHEQIICDKNRKWASKIEKNAIYFILYLVSISIFVISISNNNQTLSYLAFGLSCIYCLVTPYSYSLLIIFALSIFEGGFTVNGNCGWFFLATIIIAKWFFLHRTSKHEAGYLLPFGIILIIEAVMDLLNHGVNGGYLTVIVLLFLMYLIFSKSEEFEIDSITIYNYFVSSYLLMSLYLIGQYHGLSAFINMFMSRIGIERFGGAYNTVLAGAMGIPIYSLLVLSISVPILIYRNIGLLQRVYIYIGDAVALLIGSLTISRSFLLGGSILVFCILIFHSKNRQFRKKKTLLILIIGIGATAVLWKYSDVFHSIVDSFKYRIETDSTGGTGSRFEVAEACVNYLGNHMLALLFGDGAYGYQDVAYARGDLFSLGCHNFYLDMVMSFGIVGAGAIILFIVSFIKHNAIIKKIKLQPYLMVPLLVLAAFCFTAMRTNSIKPVIYFFVCFMIIKNRDLHMEDTK